MTTIPHIRPHIPQKYNADLAPAEKDPCYETRRLGFQVFIVDEGCTLEIEVVEASGQVTRLHTTESQHTDRLAFISLMDTVMSRFRSNFRL